MRFRVAIAVTLASCSLSLSALAAPASAYVPPGCRDGTPARPGIARRAYLAGIDSGKKLVNRAWAQVSDCDALETFADIVVTNVSSYTITGRTAYAICRHTGLVDGAFEQLDQVWTGV
jgi:hypothetical protein